jgi:DNA-binding transcriptional regulator YdaS (Cro superfamily)
MDLSSYLKGVRGRPISLAARLGVSPSLVVQWGNGKAVAPGRCPSIELESGGEVACEQLRPDVRWQRVPDPDWPHPAGRPCIDVARAPATSQQGVCDAA